MGVKIVILLISSSNTIYFGGKTKMKKAVALLLALLLAASLAACAKPTDDDPGTTTTTDTYEIALITDVGNIDDHSFNQSSYEGVVNFCTARSITYNYYRPTEDSDDARIEQVKQAVSKGAKVIVMPGYLFGATVIAMQAEYPDVMFLALDVSTSDVPEPAANTALITYQEEQAGYFAGYAAVKDGYTKLGFLGGMAVPAVVRYGYGYVQGANDAAKELGNTADVSIKYWYCGSFSANDDIKTKMSGWYTEGTEIVFSCGGSIYSSAIAAAEEAGAKVIGVDSDQANDSQLIITSAMKALSNSVELALAALYDNGGTWPAQYAGKENKLGAADNCVGLPTAADSWRFETYTVAEYEALYEQVKSGEVAVSDNIDSPPAVDITVDYQD